MATGDPGSRPGAWEAVLHPIGRKTRARAGDWEAVLHPIGRETRARAPALGSRFSIPSDGRPGPAPRSLGGGTPSHRTGDPGPRPGAN